LSAGAVIAPAVSVIVPTYQRREPVKRAVASVLSQTFRDFELVVVDDGSTDGTGETLAALGDRIRYVWQENAGVAAARNTGVEMARGRIVAFLDSDDRWLPEHLAVVTEALARHPEAVLASTCPMFRVTGHEDPRDAKLLDLRHRLIDYGATVGFTACVAVRREALLKAGCFDEGIRAEEDTDLWTRLGTLGPIATVRRRTVVYQRTDASLRDSARRAGDSLAGAERAAANLVAAVDRLPAAERAPLMGQARGVTHIAQAMRALDRGDALACSAELERADRLGALSGTSNQVPYRIRGHLSRAHELHERLRALTTMAEIWPDRHADTARHLRLLAILVALRLRRPAEAATLVAGWRWRGTLGFARRIAPTFRRRLHRIIQDRRHRGG
jgi:hypothetical protein